MTKKITVADILSFLNELAPFSLAEKWDNSGLQTGERSKTVDKLWVALDPLPAVISAACEHSVDLLITHHPLIFKPLRSIDGDTVVGGVLRQAIVNRLAIISAHTNLDSVSGGVNDLLAEKIGLKRISILAPTTVEMVKLAVFAPIEHEQRLLEALFETPAGVIGPYHCCSFRTNGAGTFRPEAGSTPFSGKIGEISHSSEVKIEVRVKRQDLGTVIARLREHHPYQTMAYDVFPVAPNADDPPLDSGLGRIGELEQPRRLAEFAEHIKSCMGSPPVKFAGDPELFITHAALCSGSGSSLMPQFFASHAQVYISGDFRYHDARDAENSQRGLIDIGHFHSEHIILKPLVQKLREFAAAKGKQMEIKAYEGETDPFIMI